MIPLVLTSVLGATGNQYSHEKFPNRVAGFLNNGFRGDDFSTDDFRGACAVIDSSVNRRPQGLGATRTAGTSSSLVTLAVKNA
jgi:hypothetical protein